MWHFLTGRSRMLHFSNYFPLLLIPSQVIDLTSISQELAYLASDADLVILEGMVSAYLKITTRVEMSPLSTFASVSFK